MYNQGYTPQQPQQGYPYYPQGSNPAWYAPPPQQAPAAAPKRRAAGGAGGGGAGGGKKPKKKRSLKWQLIKVLIVLVLLAGAGIGGYFWKTQSDVRPYVSVFLDNISVDGISLSGKTWAEGSQLVWDQVNAKQNGWYVRLKNTAGEYKDITAATLGISFDPTAALEQAWAIGHDTDPNRRKSIFDLKEEIEQAKKSTYEFSSAQQSANTAPIDTILQTLESAAYKEPQDADILSFVPDDITNPFTYQTEVYGQRLDTSAVKEQILRMVQNLESGEIMLEPKTVPPNKTVADLQKTVALRVSVTTPISTSSTEERTNNIRVAFSKINGLIIPDGGKFSFNGVVGRRTEKNGFYKAIEYAYGTEVWGIGGGVCQASTTMYLAAIQAGLNITNRVAHSAPVSYTDLGKDATVSDTRGREIDFTFRNNSGGDIYIAAHVRQSGNSKRNMVCEVRIYGPSLDNTRYELETVPIETIPKPEEPTLKEDEDMTYVTFVDEKKLVSKGREGHVVETYLCTIVDGVQVSREKVSTDTYPARADVYYVGTAERFE